jgi:hypothetical protein
VGRFSGHLKLLVGVGVGGLTGQLTAYACFSAYGLLVYEKIILRSLSSS